MSMLQSDPLNCFLEESKVKKIAEAISQLPQPKIKISGMAGSSMAYLIAALQQLLDRDILIIQNDLEESLSMQSDIENILRKEAYLFPSTFKKTFDVLKRDERSTLQQTLTAYKLQQQNRKPIVTVSYPEALFEKLIDKETFTKNIIEIKRGENMGIDFLHDFLQEHHFEEVDFVNSPGQYAIRGGIVDVFSYSNNLPYRIEFFDDCIESIRVFEIGNQYSIQKIHAFTLIPNQQKTIELDMDKNIFNYIHDDTILFIENMNAFVDAYSNICKREYKEAEKYFTDLQNIHQHIGQFPILTTDSQLHDEIYEKYSFDFEPQKKFGKDFKKLIHHWSENSTQETRQFFFYQSKRQAERVHEMIEEFDKEINTVFIQANIESGFSSKQLKIEVYTDHELFERIYKSKVKKKFDFSEAISKKILTELKPGDFVTHIDFGVGQYDGLQKVVNNGIVQETIRVKYKDGDLLYVNIGALNRISKYTGKDGNIQLNKLGTGTWERLKKRTKSKLKDIARDLINIYAKRKLQKGYSFMPDNYLQNELEASFIFEDTPDQEKATNDIKQDMESASPMDRLLCGDVGFGKTEIAIRAAFKAVCANKQVVVLVPTTILALQHFKTFTKRLQEFPCNIEYISRFRSKSEVSKIKKELKNGKIDIIIGTHKLVLGKDIECKDLGLLIIDEEQKFGVSVKEKIKETKLNIDTLALTATPIPRTLQFSLLGARDLSIMNTPPSNRLPIHTELHVFDEKVMKEVIEYELDRGGQVFFIHNRIKDLSNIADMIHNLCPSAKVCIGHGQMKGEQLEKVILSFIEGKYDVLVSTVIIETGMDIPNANTIIINQAHMYGLSDLHQMRGRVGRTNRKAFCYLFSPPLSALSSEARKRLKTIEEFSNLGSGFNIAMKDLDIRGAGNLLGAEQSGFINEMGLDTFQKILNEAINELKENEFSELFKNEFAHKKDFVKYTQIETDFELLIPNSYIHNAEERFKVYKEIATLKNEEEIHSFMEKTVDRFGPAPQIIDTLLDSIRIQWVAPSLGFEKITLKNGSMKCFFISNQQSPYFESVIFQNILQFIQSDNNHQIKQTEKKLFIIIKNIHNIKEAYQSFRTIVEYAAQPSVPA